MRSFVYSTQKKIHPSGASFTTPCTHVCITQVTKKNQNGKNINYKNRVTLHILYCQKSQKCHYYTMVEVHVRTHRLWHGPWRVIQRGTILRMKENMNDQQLHGLDGGGGGGGGCHGKHLFNGGGGGGGEETTVLNEDVKCCNFASKPLHFWCYLFKVQILKLIPLYIMHVVRYSSTLMPNQFTQSKQNGMSNQYI